MWLLLACISRSPDLPATAAVPPAPPVVTPPASSVSTLETRVMTVTLDPETLSYDPAAGTATFSPDSRVKAATYTTYILNLQSLEAALGGRPGAPVAVQVEVSGTLERSTPDDPNMPAPLGGFEYITYTGRVLAKATP